MGGERTAILSHPAGCFFLLLLPLYRLLDRLSMVTVGKIFARQGEIHLCFRLQLKITDLMFNLNINKKTAPLPTFLPAEGCVFSAHFFIFTTSKSRSCYPAVGKNMCRVQTVTSKCPRFVILFLRPHPFHLWWNCALNVDPSSYRVSIC